MQANLARKNRRVPVLCMFFLLLSMIASTIGTISYSVIPAIWKLIEKDYVFLDLIKTVTSALAHNAVTISAFFFVLIVLLLAFKPKGWAISILAFLASVFMFVVGIIVAISSVTLIIGLINGTISGTERIIITVIDIIIYLLPISISFSWSALALAGISSSILHKTAKKAIRYSFGALTVAFGIISSGMFLLSSFGNILAAIKEIINILIFKHNDSFTASMLAPMFIFANILGFIGIILLTVYFIKPYKKTFQPRETDPEIIYAIDEDDPVFHEIDGITEQEEAPITNDAAEEPECECKDEPAEAPKKRKSIFCAIKKALENRTRSFKIALALLIASIILEPAVFIIPAVAIASIVIMLRAKKRSTIIVFGILNMVLGGGPISLAAGIFMMFIPETSLLKNEDKAE